ncbi:MAG: putative bifunctional diguanylate cyclase/phosphodiesterase [Vulcanimicrobiaceae bacterium]
MNASHDSLLEGLLALPIPIFIYDAKTLAFLTVNDTAIERYGYTRAQFAAMTLPDMSPRGKRTGQRHMMRRSTRRPTVDGPWQHQTAAGTTFFVETIATNVSYGERPARALIVLDVTERIQMEQILREAEDALREASGEHAVQSDTLPGRSSRRSMERRIGTMLANRKRDVFVLYVLLDGIDIVSDTVGYATCDRFVEEAERSLRALVGEDVVVGQWRYGQFVVSGHASTSELNDLVARVEDALRKPMRNHPRKVRVGIRIGIASRPVNNRPDDFIRKAALAAHQAVGDGRVVSYFAPRMESGLRSRLALEHALHLGIEAGELRLYVQPIYDAQTARITSAEVLLRWKTPSQGLLSPAAFLEMAENTGLIIPIGAYVLNETCAFVKECERLRIDVPIAMNISAKQLSDGAFCSDVQHMMRHHDVQPSQLIFELTESTFMSNVPVASKMLNDLHDLGLRIAIDDFGTGYNSLMMLKYAGFDILKIDSAFIQDYARSTLDKAIVDSATALGRSAGLEVVAEGVETIEQATAMREAGVTAMQGFYFARPMPPAEFLRNFDPTSVAPPAR